VFPSPPIHQALFANISHSYPVISATDAKISRVLLIVVLVLHAGFAIAIKITFFAHGSPGGTDAKLPDPMGDGGDGKDGASVVRMMMGM